MWALILHYQLSGSKDQKLLLAWVRATIPEHNVTNFTTNWSDGVVLSALINKLKPGLITDITYSQPLETICHALNVAEEHFGIPQVRFKELVSVMYFEST